MATVEQQVKERPERRATLALGVLVAALAAVVYLNSLPNDFVVDDRPVIVDNAFLRRPDGLRKIFTTDVWAFFGQEGGSNYYRPLMHSASYVGWRLFGRQPAGYRALNILLHAAISLLLFLLLRRLGEWRSPSGSLRQPAPSERHCHSRRAIAGFAALLFAVHPIHVEAVAWVSALPELQCSLFFLLGFLLYLHGGAAVRGRWLAAAGVAACVLLGLLSKESGIVLPVMLAIYELFRRVQGPRFKVQGRLAAWLGIGVALAAYLLLRWNALGRLLPRPAGPPLPLGRVLAGWCALLYEYTVRVFLPLTFRPFHQLPYASGLFGGKAIAGLVIVLGLAALAAWLWRRGRIECLGVVLFFVALAPSFPASHYAHALVLGERYLYLASAGFCWLLAAGLEAASQADFGRRLRRLGVRLDAVFLLLVVLCAIRTVTFNRAWRDEVAFYEGILKTEGDAPRIRPLLVEAFIRRGRPDRALDHALSIVRMNPDDPSAHNSLGFVYWALGEPEKAIGEYQQALKLARRRGQGAFAARALNNLAVIYSQAGRMDEAIQAYEEAVQLDPGFTDAHANLGAALFTVGRLEAAEQELRTALRMNPAAADAWVHLGMVLVARRDLPAARQALGRALALDPASERARSALARIQ
jgi:tetratricopeptide (TPR) repeat protein